MNVHDFYLKIGGNFDDIMTRIPLENLIVKYLLKFLEDDNFNLLQEALEREDLESAFRASHTLKGICDNLGLTTLQEKFDELTECLRKYYDQEKVQKLFQDVKEEYYRVIELLKLLKETQ